jgi:putative CocE/NonD family hydrolase
MYFLHENILNMNLTQSSTWLLISRAASPLQPFAHSRKEQDNMSDDDRGSEAWVVQPRKYLEERPVRYALPSQPFSSYVTMQDGCRLAVDVYLPAGGDIAASGRFPTILIFTPYYRRFKLRKDSPAGTEPTPNAAKYRDLFVPRGYAVVVVDVRGTGASFGTRDSFRSPKEREDSREIADWVVAQPWSNGSLGATGVSYLGAASDFLASTGHPAVRAIAPLFAVWDTYSDHYYPGGLLLNRLAETYDDLMVALDHDKRDELKRFVYFASPSFQGPQPVDDDIDGAMVQQAVAEHYANFHMPDFITEFRFKDDTLSYDPEFDSGCFSPYRYVDGISPDIAVFSVSGWMDGAGYANGAIARYLTLPNKKQHLLLGPWDHGARINVSPWRSAEDPQFSLMGELLRFFDHYLCEMQTGLEREAPVHFFTLKEESWKAASSWPPIKDDVSLFLSADGELSSRPGCEGVDTYDADYSIGTGNQTRYERIAALDSRNYYVDWQGRDENMQCYTSETLDADRELSGHAIANLWISSSEPDAAVFVYLSEVEADGRCRYVTEGVLRALHRKETPCPDDHRTSWPWRTFSRTDAAPVKPGEIVKLRFALLPTSWRFRKGSRIRVSIACADADHYTQIPHGRPPRLTIHRGGALTASTIELPIAVDFHE